MNKNLVIVIGIVILLGIGYMIFSNKSAPQAPAPTSPQEQVVTSPAPTTRTISLAEQNDSGESGTASLTEENGNVRVVLTMTGAPKDVTQPAHIHVGACPDVGAVKYPLTFPVNGTSETMLEVNLDQLSSELPLAINVHKSGAEANVYVSCGDLSL